jgi:hypothetical protein
VKKLPRLPFRHSQFIQCQGLNRDGAALLVFSN